MGVFKSRDVDLRKVLQNELAAVPPALFHGDGTMRKTNKANLAKKLESNCPDVLTELPQTPTSTSPAYIIDGMAMVQSLNENHFRTFKDFGRSGSETYSSTSQQPVLGVELCDHCFRSL